MRVVHRRLLLVGSVAACLGAAAALPVLADDSSSLVKVTAAGGTPVPGRYIVTLKTGASTDAAAKKVRATGVRRFDGVLNGFAAKLTDDQVNKLRRDDRVAAIEQDQIVKATTTQRAPLPWGLDRIDQRSAKLSKTYTYKSSGKGVNAYIVDTGLDVGHKEFGGRAPSPGRRAGSTATDATATGTAPTSRASSAPRPTAPPSP
ncbi:S8 family serine peptidase [Actinomadura luteofluorescens]|uniref:S8 family serine peptidase n=1 Tax=Actinomadura luteofluorescens TaxID=46163 RepID=UPI00363C663D